MSFELVMPSNHLILCCPLFLLPSIFPSISVFSNESVLHIRWPKYWSYSISPSSEYLGLISFRIDWFDLFVVQGTLKSLFPTPQFQSINSRLLAPLPTLLPSPETWRKGATEISKLIIITWAFWWPSSFQELTQSCLIRTKDIPIIQKIAKVLGALDQDWLLEHKIFLVLPFTRILGALCQEPGGRDHHVLLITSQRLLNQGVDCV